MYFSFSTFFLYSLCYNKTSSDNIFLPQHNLKDNYVGITRSLIYSNKRIEKTITDYVSGVKDESN